MRLRGADREENVATLVMNSFQRLSIVTLMTNEHLTLLNAGCGRERPIYKRRNGSTEGS
jgi:hypothetical protein